MEYAKLLESLAGNYARLREVAGRDLTRPVPSCPGWTVDDLVRHVAEVYLHKTEVLRLGAWPDPWPPDLAAEPPMELLARAYDQLSAQLIARDPDGPAITFHKPDQSVRFWIRRMAQETVIHRVDAELALGEPVAAIPADLALDGIDEVLQIFVGYGAHEWTEDFAPTLAGSPGHCTAVRAEGAEWVIETGANGLNVTFATGAATPGRPGAPGVGAGVPDAVVHGPADAVLRWLWARGADGEVSTEGDAAALIELRSLLVVATQ
jgi:uncharacterized protein (TIGR03083 family)